MNAEPLLSSVAAALAEVKLEAVLIGNAAAAIHGAPVTTVDLDFMFRSTPGNITKLKRFAKCMDAVVLRPFYPVSALFRVMHDDRGLQVDFMPAIHGENRSMRCGRGRSSFRWECDLYGWRICQILSPASGRQGGRGIKRCWRFWRRR